MSEKQMTPFWRLTQLLWLHRKKVLLINGLVAVGALVFSLLLPKWYEGRVTFIVNEETDIGSSLATAVLGGVGLPGGLLGGAAPLADQYVGYLQSVTILDRVDSLYSLQEIYEEEYRTVFYRTLLANCAFDNNGDNTITIRFYYEEDPDKAAAIANSFYEELDKLVTRLRQEKNRNVRIFLEDSYEQNMSELYAAQENLAAFQIDSRLFAAEEQLPLLIESIGELEQEKVKLQIEKVYMEGLGMTSTSEYQATVKKISAVQNKIDELEFGDEESVPLALNNIPAKVVRYARLFGEVEIRKKILEFVIPQLETARVEELRESSNLQLLDPAAPQDYKAKPKRILVIFVFVFISSTLTILVLLIRDFINNNRQTIRSIANGNGSEK